MTRFVGHRKRQWLGPQLGALQFETLSSEGVRDCQLDDLLRRGVGQFSVPVDEVGVVVVEPVRCFPLRDGVVEPRDLPEGTEVEPRGVASSKALSLGLVGLSK
jgi:hypothetical protein